MVSNSGGKNNHSKQTQETKSTLRCALSLSSFPMGKKLNTTQRGASQGGFLLLGLFRTQLSAKKTTKAQNFFEQSLITQKYS